MWVQDCMLPWPASAAGRRGRDADLTAWRRATARTASPATGPPSPDGHGDQRPHRPVADDSVEPATKTRMATPLAGVLSRIVTIRDMRAIRNRSRQRPEWGDAGPPEPRTGLRSCLPAQRAARRRLRKRWIGCSSLASNSPVSRLQARARRARHHGLLLGTKGITAEGRTEHVAQAQGRVGTSRTTFGSRAPSGPRLRSAGRRRRRIRLTTRTCSACSAGDSKAWRSQWRSLEHLRRMRGPTRSTDERFQRRGCAACSQGGTGEGGSTAFPADESRALGCSADDPLGPGHRDRMWVHVDEIGHGLATLRAAPSSMPRSRTTASRPCTSAATSATPAARRCPADSVTSSSGRCPARPRHPASRGSS